MNMLRATTFASEQNHTHPKFNIAPDKWWVTFQGLCQTSGGVLRSQIPPTSYLRRFLAPKKTTKQQKKTQQKKSLTTSWDVPPSTYPKWTSEPTKNWHLVDFGTHTTEHHRFSFLERPGMKRKDASNGSHTGMLCWNLGCNWMLVGLPPIGCLRPLNRL